MLTKTFAVAAIENGTVIDHIQAGQGLKIVQLLKLAKHQKRVTLGLNLPSETLGFKDLIKVEARILTPDEANQIALLSPKATISIIQHYDVKEKFQVQLPDTISGILTCSNPRCITNHEPIPTRFHVVGKRPQPKLMCHFCRKSYEGAIHT